ncbi:CoA pyrophosphatase [Vulcanisaeta sp. JCM 16161]|uniref:NUDIX hydrolase n=1 Tax=Vulcanisaeta sp. JCM 16161 TaxID=1295372 RepID=UPI0006CF2883|nr:CoA pyrophosphatase [Vulcanisaeta sp. JCM 16161]
MESYNVAKLRRIVKNNRPIPDNEHLWAAVAVIYNPCLNAFLIGKRTENPEDPWSGDAAFPGGRFKPAKDRDLVETAIREAREEVGLDLTKDAELLGVLDPFSPSNAPNINVIPVIFSLRDCNPQLTVNKAELSKVFWLGVGDVVKYVKLNINVKGKTRPAIIMGDVTIWGMTYRILRRLLREAFGIDLPKDPRDTD